MFFLENLLSCLFEKSFVMVPEIQVIFSIISMNKEWLGLGKTFLEFFEQCVFYFDYA